MLNIQTVTGMDRFFFNIRLNTITLAHYFKKVLKGEVSFKRVLLSLQRSACVHKIIQKNKFIRFGSKTRVHLYTPAIPSQAYFTVCDKFLEFGRKLPCQVMICSITAACKFKCEHCYQRMDKGKDVDIEKLIRAAQYLQDQGVPYFIIEGGEPFLAYDKMIRLCDAIDERSEIWVFSTGFGMAVEKIRELKQKNVVTITFSLHSHDPEVHNRFMNSDIGWQTMENGIDICHRADMPIAFNICLGKQAYYDGQFEKIIEKAKEYRPVAIQLIHPKPAGAWLGSGSDHFSEADVQQVKSLVETYNTHRDYAAYPPIFAQVVMEDKAQFGCTAGGTERVYINSTGDVQPCEFLNLSFGNIETEDFGEIYEKMRTHFEVPGERWLCQDYSPEIYRIYKENNLTTLPLDYTLSSQLYNTWDRGGATPLYTRLEKELTISGPFKTPQKRKEAC